MRSVLCHGPRDYHIAEIPVPVPKPGEVMVKVLGVGICASDIGGGLAALCYDNVATGLHVDELELVLPLDAVPTRRGLPRIAPGRFLPAPMPIAIAVSAADVPLEASVALADAAPLRVIAA